MCSIAGLILNSNKNNNTIQLIQYFKQSLSHRGPDDSGVFSKNLDINHSKSLHLIHQRLSILDLSVAASQPMQSHDGRFCIIFNGEIYNYLELKKELKSKGYIFKSRSDTEVLLNAFIEWGTKVLARLVGMFAFCIFDAKTNKLFLARDFFGIKPLYYTFTDQYFAFASEIPALLKISGLRPQANLAATYNYLHSNYTDHNQTTLFEGISQLLPSHYLEVSLDSLGNLQPQCFWKVNLENRSQLSFEEASLKLKNLFLESIQLHLRSDVAIGSALSGGIDSSAIVMAMRAVQGDSLDLHTFSYIPNQIEFSEENWINQVNKASNAISHKVSISPEDLIRDLNQLIATQGEPFGSTSIYAQYRVFQLAKKVGIKVMLDGQGADELLGGYRPYLAARLASLILQGQYKKAYQFLRRASQLSGTGTRYLLTRTGGLLLPEQFQLFARYLVSRQSAPPWMNGDWVKDHGFTPMPLRLNQQSDVLQEQLYRAVTQVSLPLLLRYEDRNSMAHSIESRVPFLTPALAEFIFSLPEEYLISSEGISKNIFRHAMRGIVPDPILDRRDKIGFATPERTWTKQMKPWFEGTLKSETAQNIPLLNINQMQTTFSRMITGQIPFDSCIWRWVNLIRWAEFFNVDFGV